MNSENYFISILEIEPFYETENVFFQPFWDFKYRFQSLQRHWFLNKDFVSKHISLLQNAKGDGSAEFDDIFSETAGVDIDFFPDYLRLSTVSVSLSLLENLLASLSEEVAKDLGLSIDLDKRPLPYINKYLLWFTRTCGLDITLDKNVWRELDAIREVRNRFIHKIDRDIPVQVKAVISEMIDSALDEKNLITDEFVVATLKRIATLVKSIELSYIKFYEANKI